MHLCVCAQQPQISRDLIPCQCVNVCVCVYVYVHQPQVSPRLVKSLLDESQWERYHAYGLRSFIENNKRMCW